MRVGKRQADRSRIRAPSCPRRRGDRPWRINRGGSARAAAGDEIHRFVNEIERPIKTYLHARRPAETLTAHVPARTPSGRDTDGTRRCASPPAASFRRDGRRHRPLHWPAPRCRGGVRFMAFGDTFVQTSIKGDATDATAAQPRPPVFKPAVAARPTVGRNDAALALPHVNVLDIPGGGLLRGTHRHG